MGKRYTKQQLELQGKCETKDTERPRIGKDFWQTFAKTGTVADYLSYRMEAGSEYESDSGDGDDSVGDADGRI